MRSISRLPRNRMSSGGKQQMYLKLRRKVVESIHTIPSMITVAKNNEQIFRTFWKPKIWNETQKNENHVGRERNMPRPRGAKNFLKSDDLSYNDAASDSCSKTERSWENRPVKHSFSIWTHQAQRKHLKHPEVRVERFPTNTSVELMWWDQPKGQQRFFLATAIQLSGRVDTNRIEWHWSLIKIHTSKAISSVQSGRQVLRQKLSQHSRR